MAADTNTYGFDKPTAYRLKNGLPMEGSESGESPIRPTTLIYGFHATSGIDASTINTTTPTSSTYKSALCKMYRLDWTSPSHIPVKLTDAAGNDIEAYVINPTSTAIATNQMLWGAKPAGTRDGIQVYMALVEDCA